MEKSGNNFINMSINKKGNKNDSEIQCLYLIENEVQKKLMRQG